MATIHGRGGMLYMQGSGAAALKLGEARSWSLKIDRDFSEDNALGDTWKTQLLGLMSWSGAVEGNFDAAEASPFDAVMATSVRKIYLYPDSTAPTRYYYGSVWPKLSGDVKMSDTVRFSLDFTGDGTLAQN